MTKKLIGALVCAIALGATAAPSANAGTVCATGYAALQKSGVYENFETVYIYWGDEVPFVVGTACRTTP